MSVTANYAATPKPASVLVSAANTNRDGTGTLATVFTAGASGSRIDDIVIAAIGTTTAGMVRLYLHNGTSAFLLTEIPVSAITPSGTLAAFRSVLLDQGLILATGWSLRASTHNAESFHVTVTRGGDF